MYYTPGHLCSDENYTLVQFVETIIWFNLMKLYMFFKLMAKMCVVMVIDIDPIPLHVVTVRLR